MGLGEDKKEGPVLADLKQILYPMINPWYYVCKPISMVTYHVASMPTPTERP